MARVRYFAAAEEFAGRAEEHRVEPDVATLRRALTAEYAASPVTVQKAVQQLSLIHI